MPTLNEGLNSFNPNTSIGGFYNNFSIFPARVTGIILDDKTHPKLFKKYGEWSSIGLILYQPTNNPQPSKLELKNVAKPLFPNFLNYPLVNEIVYIISLPGTKLEKDTNDSIMYYFNPINIWNSVHHNAIPDSVWISDLPPSQNKDYVQTEAGNVRKVEDGSTEIFLGKTFNEKINTKNLLPYEGDIIFEGRWGNTIRFGSTVNNSIVKNMWSNSGENGNPITILVNGQYDNGYYPWIPITENINEDSSSIYLTSNQQIPIEAASAEYDSYSDTVPINPNQYIGSQVILTSGRLLFNSKSDHILLSSNKTINLNAQEGFNFDTPNGLTINVGTTIKLGDKEAEEPILLGNKTVDLLNELLAKIIELSGPSALQMPFLNAAGAAINMGTISSAAQLNLTALKLKNKLETLKSKTSFTI